MKPDQKAVQEFLEGVLSGSRDQLSADMKKVADRFCAVKEMADRISQELGKAQEQLKQTEARVRTTELQLHAEVGKANGLADVLVSARFGDQEDKPAVPAKN
jgi:predicted RNase H-related nuclease YkuK (DUF458 family)